MPAHGAENIRAAIEARAVICIYGQTGRGKSLAVNTSLRELAPKLTRRIQFPPRRLGRGGRGGRSYYGLRELRVLR